MNKKQIDLLIKSGYEVIPEIGFIKENTLGKPLVYLIYNQFNKTFSLGIVGTQFDNNNDLNFYQMEFDSKLKLASELNNLKD